MRPLQSFFLPPGYTPTLSSPIAGHSCARGGECVGESAGQRRAAAADTGPVFPPRAPTALSCRLSRVATCLGLTATRATRWVSPRKTYGARVGVAARLMSCAAAQADDPGAVLAALAVAEGFSAARADGPAVAGGARVAGYLPPVAMPINPPYSEALSRGRREKAGGGSGGGGGGGGAGDAPGGGGDGLRDVGGDSGSVYVVPSATVSGVDTRL